MHAPTTNTMTLNDAAMAFMQPIAEAWLANRGGVVDSADGERRLRYATASGRALKPAVCDAGDGEVVGLAGDDVVRARARRWDVAEDIGWSNDAINQFFAMQAGRIKQSAVAKATGCNLASIASLDDLREKLRGRDGDKWALALSPAKVDDAPGLFLASELMVHLPEIVKVERVMPYARQILPMRFINAPGADSYRFTVLDDFGDAQWASNMDGPVPMVGQKRTNVIRPLEYIWMGAQWGIRELMQWQQARSNGARLPDFASERPRIAREAILRTENMWLFFGGPANSKILGLFSPDNAIPKQTASTHWTGLSEAANLSMVQANVTAIRTTYVEVPDTILMPVAQYDYYATKQWPSTDKMLLQVMMESLKPLGIQDIIAIPECGFSSTLEAALAKKKYSAADAQRYAGGVDGKDAMVVLTRDESKIAGICAQDVKSLPPEVRPTMTSVTLISSSGGCEVRKPKAHSIQPFNPPA